MRPDNMPRPHAPEHSDVADNLRGSLSDYAIPPMARDDMRRAAAAIDAARKEGV